MFRIVIVMLLIIVYQSCHPLSVQSACTQLTRPGC
jgi:hypothetical protein